MNNYKLKEESSVIGLIQFETVFRGVSEEL